MKMVSRNENCGYFLGNRRSRDKRYRRMRGTGRAQLDCGYCHMLLAGINTFFKKGPSDGLCLRGSADAFKHRVLVRDHVQLAGNVAYDPGCRNSGVVEAGSVHV